MQKFINKTNIGIVSTLLLLIAISQSNILSFFFNTYLGRSLLILIILLISYTNQILGVVAVLFIIIMFNTQMTNHRENFTNDPNTSDTNNTNNTTDTGNKTDANTGNLPEVKKINVVSNNKNRPKLDISSTINPETDEMVDTVDTNMTTEQFTKQTSIDQIEEGELGEQIDQGDPIELGDPIDVGDPIDQGDQMKEGEEKDNSNLLTSTEGFDILGRENQLKRGKQSNSIMVSDYMRQSSTVLPYESDKFSYLSSY